MSRAAWHRPCSATSTSASPSLRSRCGARSRSDVKKSFSSLMNRPSRQNAASRTSPALAAAARSGVRAMPVQVADSDAGPPIVRCPPTTSTPSRSAAQARPSSTSAACASSGLTSMSRMASGRPPMARTSETFVTTAAAPAARGCAATNDGRIASPQSTIHSSPWAMSAPSSPSPTGPRPRTSCRSRLACRAGSSRIAAANAWTSDTGVTLDNPLRSEAGRDA